MLPQQQLNHQPKLKPLHVEQHQVKKRHQAKEPPTVNAPVLISQTTNIQQITTESQPIIPQEHDPNEEHYSAAASPCKSSISDIKPSDFYEEES